MFGFRGTWKDVITGIFVLAFVGVIFTLVFSSNDRIIFVSITVFLAGVLLAIYWSDRVTDFMLNPQSGIRVRLSKLENRIQQTSNQVNNQEARVDKQEEELRKQQQLINELVKYSMSASIFDHLCGIGLLKKYNYFDGEGNRREMYFLRDNGLIRPKDNGFLDFNEQLNGKNIVDIAELTEIGWSCIALRKNTIPSNMLGSKDNLRTEDEKVNKILANLHLL